MKLNNNINAKKTNNDKKRFTERSNSNPKQSILSKKINPFNILEIINEKNLDSKKYNEKILQNPIKSVKNNSGNKKLIRSSTYNEDLHNFSSANKQKKISNNEGNKNPSDKKHVNDKEKNNNNNLLKEFQIKKELNFIFEDLLIDKFNEKLAKVREMF